MKNPIKMDDLGVPLFLETPIYIYVYMYYIDELKFRMYAGFPKFSY